MSALSSSVASASGLSYRKGSTSQPAGRLSALNRSSSAYVSGLELKQCGLPSMHGLSALPSRGPIWHGESRGGVGGGEAAGEIELWPRARAYVGRLRAGRARCLVLELEVVKRKPVLKGERTLHGSLRASEDGESSTKNSGTARSHGTQRRRAHEMQTSGRATMRLRQVRLRAAVL